MRRGVDDVDGWVILGLVWSGCLDMFWVLGEIEGVKALRFVGGFRSLVLVWIHRMYVDAELDEIRYYSTKG